MTVHLMPSELVQLAGILEAALEEHRHEWSDEQRRVAEYVAGAARHNAAAKGVITQSTTTRGRVCETCGRQGGIAYRDGDVLRVEHPRCRAFRLTPGKE